MKLEPLPHQDIDRLRPQWLALHAHHQAVAPSLAPYVTDEQSWRQRKRQYKEAFEGGAFGVLARNGSTDIGYLLCAKRPMQWNATFSIASTLWELVTLFVDPRWRGQGVGSKMLDAMNHRIAESDTRTQLIGVIPDNTRAVRLYESRGYVPSWLTLTRFQRPLAAAGAGVSATVERGEQRDVDDLKELWLQLHHHHQAVSPHLGPWVPDNASWPVIRALLEKDVEDGFIFVAKDKGRKIGFASVAIYDRENVPSYSDTWQTGPQIAETKFLVVAKDARGRGIGTALMDAVDRELERRGIQDHLIGAIAPNAGAISFYSARGFRPAWLELTKFGPRLA